MAIDDKKKLVSRDIYWFKESSAKVTAFPQDYFSGCDIGINFENERMADVLSLQFTLQEQLRPVYGYSSRVYDTLAVGNRIVTGQVAIAFSSSKRMKDLIKKSDENIKKRMPADVVKEITNISATVPVGVSINYAGIAQLGVEGGPSPGVSWDDVDLTGDTRVDIVNIAKSLKGSAYVWGASGQIIDRITWDSLVKIYDKNNSNGHYSQSHYSKSAGKRGFDCRGFVHYVYKQAGIKIGLNKVTTMVAQSTGDFAKISKAQLKPGDVVCVGSVGNYSHIGIYIGDGKIIEAANRDKGVVESSLSQSRWTDCYTCLRQPAKAAKPQTTLPSNWTGPQMGALSLDYREVEKCRGPELWNKRYSSRNVSVDELNREVISSDEFAYEAENSFLKFRQKNLDYTGLRYMPVDKVNKIILYHSVQYPVDIEDLQYQMKMKGKGGVGIHFLIKKDGVIQTGMPVCFSVEKDAAIHIMLEGYFDKEFDGNLTTFKPENLPPTKDQMDALIGLIDDLKSQMTGLNSIYAYREYLVSNKQGKIGEETSPGVLFPMLDIGQLTGLDRPTNVAHQFFNFYLNKYGANNLDDLLEKEMSQENEEIEVRLSAPASMVTNDGGGGKSYPADYIVKKYESGGAINKITYDSNDHYAFGIYQFNADSGLHALMTYLSKKNTTIYNMLKGANSTSYYDTTEYQNKWLAVCNKYPQEFAKLQYDHAYEKYCVGAINDAKRIAKNMGVNFKYSDTIAFKNMAWSCAVQCGNGGFQSVITKTFMNKAACEKDQKSFIEEFYLAKTAYFKSIPKWSEQLKTNVINSRVKGEIKIAMEMIGASTSQNFEFALLDIAVNDGGGGSVTISKTISGTIKSGTKNSYVKELQQGLNANGANLTVDGSFGPKTIEAVKAFENKNNLKGKILVNNTINQAGWDVFRKALESNGSMNASGKLAVNATPGSGMYGATNGATISELTSSIWGFNDIETKKDETQAYFYNDSTPYVQLSGIDVTIRYGYDFDGKTYANESPTRIEKLKNVQLRSVGKQIAPTGEVIAEIYEFIARDIE